MNIKIDIHTHYTPPSMKERLKQYSETEPFWGLLVTPDPEKKSIQGWATPERMIEDMDKAGIDKAALLGIYRQTAENSCEANNDTLKIIQKYPDRIMGFGMVAPRPLDRAIDEIKRCVDNGMIGIGELNPYAQGVAFDSPEFLKIAETCIDKGIALNIHCNEEVGHFYAGKSPVRLMDYYQFACRFPELKLILAHWGGGLLFYEIMPEVRKNLQNVYYDLAATPLTYPTELMIKTALQCVDHKKLVYGSDYPLLICPRKQHEPDFRPFLEEINAVGLPEDVYDDLMGRNAARILGLLPTESVETASATVKTTTPVLQTSDKEKSKGVTAFGPNTAVSYISNAYPATRQVFEQYGIPWKDSPVAFWEPIAQAAAARGYGPTMLKKIITELEEAASK